MSLRAPFHALLAAFVLALLSGLMPAAAQVQSLPRPGQGTAPQMSQPARSANVVQTDNVRAELIAEVSRIKPGEPFWVGLKLDIRDRWHTYWRNPGDSGMPTEIAWQLPEGSKAGPIVWPVPHLIRVGPLANYGYSKQVLLPTRIEPPSGLQAGASYRITVQATWLVCEDVCIPEEGSFSFTLPVGESAAIDARTQPLFEATRRATPIASPWQAHYSGRGEKSLVLTIEAPGLKPDSITDVYFFPDAAGPVEHSAEQKRTIDGNRIRLEIARSAAAPALPASLDGVLTIAEKVAGNERPIVQAFEIKMPLQAAVYGSAGVPPLESIGLIEALLLALVGGMILNLMPCVFPILSMKALALIGHRREERTQLRANGLAYTAGVLASFAAIGVVIAVLRSSGESLGWGFQFQSPIFTLLVSWLFFVIGLNLSGVFEIGGRLAGVGSGLAGRGDLAGAFFTGVLATVVATPCTAPFMAAAVGFALAQPAAISLAVLLVMGLGLALPYLLLTLLPGLLRFLPRPGAWMVRLRQVLAFPMYASAAWLVWVLSLQAGGDAVLQALLGMVLLAFGIFVWQVAGGSARALWRQAGLATLLLAVIGGGALAWSLVQAPTPNADRAGAAAQPGADANWERFSRARLAELREAGKPVFVNFTAAWCITCLANDRVALATEATKRAFAADGVTYLKGDWTNRDPEITATLQEFGRAGVPLYLLYSGPAERPAEILPQILTEGEILARLSTIRTAMGKR